MREGSREEEIKGEGRRRGGGEGGQGTKRSYAREGGLRIEGGIKGRRNKVWEGLTEGGIELRRDQGEESRSREG